MKIILLSIITTIIIFALGTAFGEWLFKKFGL